MNRYLTSVAVGIFIGLASPVLAHGSMAPSHGGLVEMAGETLAEIVPNTDGVDVYFSDGHDPLPADTFDAKLIVTPAVGEKFDAILQPASGNWLTAPGVTPSAGTKIVVSVTDKGTGIRSFATFQYE